MAKIIGSTWDDELRLAVMEGSEPKVLINEEGPAHAVGGGFRKDGQIWSVRWRSARRC